MRQALLFLLTILSAVATAIPNILPFFTPLFNDFLGIDSSNNNTLPTPTDSPANDLFRRQLNPTACASSYRNCAGLGAPGLCCAQNAVCSADFAGHVACCPVGAACTGTIGAITGSASGLSSATGSSTSGGFVFASTTTTQGFSTASADNAGQTTLSAGDGNGIILSSGSTVAVIPANSGAERGVRVVGLSVCGHETIHERMLTRNSCRRSAFGEPPLDCCWLSVHESRMS